MWKHLTLCLVIIVLIIVIIGLIVGVCQHHRQSCDNNQPNNSRQNTFARPTTHPRPTASNEPTASTEPTANKSEALSTEIAETTLPDVVHIPSISVAGAATSESGLVYLRGYDGLLLSNQLPIELNTRYAIQLAYFDSIRSLRGPLVNIASGNDIAEYALRDSKTSVSGGLLYASAGATLGFSFESALDPRFEVQLLKRPFEIRDGQAHWISTSHYVVAASFKPNLGQKTLTVAAGSW